MNPYQVVVGIAFCVLMFSGVVTVLTVQGVPLPLAFLGVYLSAVWCMVGMQRRARESYGCMEYPRRRHREPSVREGHVMHENPGAVAGSGHLVAAHDAVTSVKSFEA